MGKRDEHPAGGDGTSGADENAFTDGVDVGNGDGDGNLNHMAARLADVERGLEERNDQYLRLAADFENFKRRKVQEFEERSRYASEDAVREILPVLDNLQRALSHLPPEADGAVVDGLGMVIRSFEAAFERLGVTPIATEGHPFDPALHEAVMAEESAEVDRDMVAQELQRGYRLHDRVLRPAMVKVVQPAAGVVSGRKDDQE